MSHIIQVIEFSTKIKIVFVRFVTKKLKFDIESCDTFS